MGTNTGNVTGTGPGNGPGTSPGSGAGTGTGTSGSALDQLQSVAQLTHSNLPLSLQQLGAASAVEVYLAAWAPTSGRAKAGRLKLRDRLFNRDRLASGGTPASLAAQPSPGQEQGQGQGQVQVALPTLATSPAGSGPVASHHDTASLPMPPLPHRSVGVFGMQLNEHMIRDRVHVPVVVALCIQVVEELGLITEGLYRISGATSRLGLVKAAFDTGDWDHALDVLREEGRTDVHTVTSTLKLYLRELPEPLIPAELYNEILAAAQIPNKRALYVRFHQLVNALPDANYATLRAASLHWGRVAQHASQNHMSISNLGLCLGPTLCRQPSPATTDLAAAQLHLPLQSKAIESIIEYSQEIFILDD